MSTQVGSVTSSEVRCATASCRVGSKASPFSPNELSPNLVSELVSCSATEPNGPTRSPCSRARTCRRPSVRSLLVALVDDLGVHHVVATGRLTGAAGPAGGTGTRTGLLVGGTRVRRLRVQQRAGLLRGRRQLLVRGPDLLDVVAAERAAQLAERLADLVLRVGRQLVAALREELLGLPLELLGQVAGLRLLAAPLVVVGVLLRVAHHPLDVVLGPGRPTGD